MRIQSCNLFGKNSGNKQTLHFCFKIQYISRLERTTKCCQFDFTYSPDHCPHLIPSDLSLLLLQQNNYYTKPEGCWKASSIQWPQESSEAAKEMVIKPLYIDHSQTQTEKNKMYKLWNTYYVPSTYKYLKCLYFHSPIGRY